MEELKSIANTAKNITIGYVFFTIIQNTWDMLKRMFAPLFKFHRTPKPQRSNVTMEDILKLLPAGEQLAVKDAIKTKNEGKGLSKAQVEALHKVALLLDDIK